MLYGLFILYLYASFFFVIGLLVYLFLDYTKLGQRLSKVDRVLLEIDQIVEHDPNYGNEPIEKMIKEKRKGGTNEKRYIV